MAMQMTHERVHAVYNAVRSGRCKVVNLHTVEQALLLSCQTDFLPPHIEESVLLVERELHGIGSIAAGGDC
jgi:hypothetical protein